MTRSSIFPPVTDEEVSRRMEFADAALAAAGHEVTDPRMRSLVERVARKELTAEEALAAAQEFF